MARRLSRVVARAAAGTRAVPGMTAARRALRPLRREQRLLAGERLILRSGVFDTKWYEAQTGMSFASDRAAVRHYLRAPRAEARSPHPLFEPEWADAQGWRSRAVDPLVWYLESRTAHRRATPHPLVDLTVLREYSPEASEHEFGPWAWWASSGGDLPQADGTTMAWGPLRAELLRAAAEHQAQTLLAASPRVVEHLPREMVPSRSLPTTTSRRADGAPLVTIVMPTWNRGGLMRRAIESVQAQTFQDWELVVVDDGSTDDTLAVLEGVAAFDDRVRAVPTERGGVCRARNVGIAEARGELVAFLDSDNTWRPEFLTAMVDALTTNDWEMGHAALQINARGGTSYRHFEGTRDHLLVANHIDLNVLLVRRSLLETIGGFDESLRRAVDYDLVLRLSERAPLHQVDVVGADYTDNASDPHRISVAEPLTWNSVVRSRHLVDWEAGRGREPVPGRVSVVLPVRRDIAATVRWMRALQDVDGGCEDVELVVVGSGVSRSHHCLATAMAQSLATARVLRTPSDVGLAVATNVGLGVVTGETVVLCRPNITPTAGWLRALVDALGPDVAVAQPLLTRGDGSIASAGAVFAPDHLFPSPFLEGFPASDARRLGTFEAPAAYSGVVALRASTALELEGYDALLGNSLAETDLSLRARALGYGTTVVVTEAVVTSRAQARFGFPHDQESSVRILQDRWSGPPLGSEDLWRQAGFEVAGYRHVRTAPGPKNRTTRLLGRRPDVRRRTLEVDEHLPRLRWTVDIAAPAGPKGELWGDTHFARALARALESLGQDVAVDFREARERGTREFDDVLLVLRGLDPVLPPPGPVSIQWIISHPEAATPKESAAFDLVFAASQSWAQDRTTEWGFDVRPLLQCTDPQLFHPGRGEPDSGPPVLFVGNSRKILRPSLREAVAAGADVWVYGSGWGGLVDDAIVRAPSVSNDEVGSLYASASVVLNDHWDDMRRDGFLSNRLFDAVACGARVVSDDVPGLSEIFGESVQPFRHARDMDRLLGEPFHRHFPDRAGRLAQSERVRAEHSFDRRAEQLLDAAVRLRVQRAAREGSAALRDSADTLRRW